MYLGNFIKNLDRKYYKTYFSGVAFNSKQVKKDNIFFAIKGTKFDGNRYITDAIKKGARIIISEKDIKLNNKNIIVLKSNNPRKLLAETSFKLIKKKPKNFIAVTGTNGKSSVADFYYQMLSLNKKNAASIGTIGVQLNNKKNSTENTTFDPIKLRKVINYLGIKKIKNIILEASSHGLKQNRLDGLLFDIGIFTNLSHDHLDYHKNYKDYLNAKLYLFNNLIKKNGTVIADPTILQFKKIKRLVDKKKLKLLTILNSNTDLELVSHKYENDHQILTVKERNKKKHIRLNKCVQSYIFVVGYASNPLELERGGFLRRSRPAALNITHRATTEHGLGTLEQQQPANRHWPCRQHEPTSPYPPRPEQQHREITQPPATDATPSG